MSMLRTLAGTLCAGALAAMLMPTAAFAGGEGWGHDMAAAMKQAKEEKKDLLMDFTGSDWCGWCIKLNEEVFSQEAFKADAPKHFVLVELDFPNDKSNLSEETQKQNDEWQKKLGVQGFPTIFLADEQGRPYAQTGYQQGGAETYVQHLAELREKRVARDKAYAAAAKAKGVEKAKHLDEAMEAVGEQLALSAYAADVKEIIKLDGKNEAGLKEKYEAKLAAAEFEKEMMAIQQDFNGQNADELIARLDEAASKVTLGEQQTSQVNQLKIGLLGAAGKHEESIALIDTILSGEDVEPMDKIRMGLRKVGALQQLKRVDDAIKTYDEMVAVAPTENDVKAQVLMLKGNFLLEEGKKEEAGKAYDEAIAAASDAGLKAHLEEVKKQAQAAPEGAATSGE